MDNYYFLFSGIENWNYMCSSSLSHQKSNFPLVIQDKTTSHLNCIGLGEGVVIFTTLPHTKTWFKGHGSTESIVIQDRETNDVLDIPTTNWGFIS